MIFVQKLFTILANHKYHLGPSHMLKIDGHNLQ
jgi:hypothetical protein